VVRARPDGGAHHAGLEFLLFLLFFQVEHPALRGKEKKKHNRLACLKYITKNQKQKKTNIVLLVRRPNNNRGSHMLET